ncbi:MAG: pyridoxal phosphate-dependent aminotransferase [Spirochaetota bacterium]
MKLSDRILQIQPSPTLYITALAKEMKSQGIDVVSFGAGEPDFDTPQNIKDAAVDAIAAGMTKYTPAGGINELKQAIADKFVRDNSLAYGLNEIVVNCGGKHSFYNLMQVLLDPEDEVVIPAPYWVSYPPMVQLAGGKPVILDTNDMSDFKITPQQLTDSITPKTKGVVINSPSNPTGSSYTEQEIRDLAAVVEGKDIFIISDDIYESIIYNGKKFFNSAMISEDFKHKTIILNGVSKTYSMTGWRIGYMAGDADVMKKVGILQSQSTSNPCSIAQWAAVEAINGDQSFIAKMVETFARRRDLIVDKLNAIDGITVNRPDGAFYVFPNISGIRGFDGWKKIESGLDGDSFSSKFTEQLLKDANVAAVPGIAFGADDYMRLSFATSDELIQKGVDRIAQFVATLR